MWGTIQNLFWDVFQKKPKGRERQYVVTSRPVNIFIDSSQAPCPKFVFFKNLNIWIKNKWEKYQHLWYRQPLLSVVPLSVVLCICHRKMHTKSLYHSKWFHVSIANLCVSGTFQYYPSSMVLFAVQLEWSTTNNNGHLYLYFWQSFKVYYE